MADLERSTGAAPAPIRDADIDSLPSLFGRLGDDVMTLLDAKLSLLKVEVNEEATAYIGDGVMIAIGGVIARDDEERVHVRRDVLDGRLAVFGGVA